MKRKRIQIPSMAERALRDLATDENGADYQVLSVLASYVLSGKEIEPDFQKVANAIMAQAILCNALPPKRKGRPKGDEEIGRDVAQRYFDLIDGGASYAEAVAAVASAFHKDERHIMRLVATSKHIVGETKESRDSKRAWWLLCAEMEAASIQAGGESSKDRYESLLLALQKEDERDPLSDLDVLIEEVLNRRFPLTDTK